MLAALRFAVQWDKVVNADFHTANIKWFENGELNVSGSCGRHRTAAARGHR